MDASSVFLQDSATPGFPADAAHSQGGSRSALLLTVARRILASRQGIGMLAEEVFAMIRDELGADLMFNYRMQAGPVLELVGSCGLSEAVRTGAAQLQHWQAVCGQVAATAESVEADETRIAGDEAAFLLREMGVRAYACNPLLGRDGEVIGTFSVGSRTRSQFAADDIEFIQAVSHFLALALDRQRSEEETLASEARHRDLLDSITDSFFALDREWRFTYINRSAEQNLRRKREELLGKVVWDEFVDTPDGQFRRAYDRALATGETVCFELFYPPHQRWYAMRAYPTPTGLSIYGHDITEQKQAEQALEEARERLQIVQKAARIGSFEWNLDSGMISWSEELAALYGLSSDEFGGRYEDWAARVHPDDLGEVEQCMQAALQGIEGQDEAQAQWRIVLPDGSHRWIFGRIKVFKDGSGRLQRMAGINIDITERKQAEEVLREADRKKDEFLSVLAHELRNPLAPVRNGLQILGMAPAGSPESVETLQMMERQIAHMVRLIDDLLDVSRISQGRIRLQRQRLALRDVIDSAIEVSHPFIAAARHQLTVQMPYEALYLEGDLTRLSQVVGNLLINAAKYTPEEGRITITALREEADLLIRVKDNGIGIPEDMLPRVFEMFAQVDKNLDRAQGGLGIGLSISRRLVEMHRGTIEVDSRGPGRGSVFTVRLPLADPPQRSAPEPTAMQADTDQARRVLVVDDSADAANSLATMLKLFGYEVRAAYSGHDALCLARDFRPGVMFCDIGMPGMTGYEVAQRLREKPEFAHLPLAALTGWGNDDDKRQAFEAGFDFHLTKPVKVTAVQDVLAQCFKAKAHAAMTSAG